MTNQGDFITIISHNAQAGHAVRVWLLPTGGTASIQPFNRAVEAKSLGGSGTKQRTTR